MIPNVRRALRLAGMRPLPRWHTGRAIPLRGRRILLTGASSGIGAVAARKLAAEGATIIAVARRESPLREVVDRITASGGDAVAIPADLSDLDEVDAVVERAGSVDVLINNAARSIRRPLSESLTRWHDVERVLPEASPMFAPYNASKAALSAVSRVIDTEWGESGVHSTTIYYPLAPRSLNKILERETARMNARNHAAHVDPI